MSTKRQPGDGGLSNPVVYDDIEQASAAATAQAETDAAIERMTPQDRAAWLTNLSASDPKDVE